MRRLSSPLTSFYKRVLPVFWLGALVAFAGHAVWRVPQAATGTLLLAGIVAAVGMLVFLRQMQPLADEVWLDDHALLVIRRRVRTRIPLREVAGACNVATGQPHIVVTLHGPSPPCRPISFLPLTPAGMFRRRRPPPVAAELMERMRAAAASA